MLQRPFRFTIVRKIPLFALALFAAACSSGTPSAGTSTDGGAAPGNEAGTPGGDDDDVGGATDKPRAGGLTLASATTNVTSIDLPTTYDWDAPRTGATSVEFVAIVTHATGRDAIAGGTLEDTTGVTYTAFQLGSTNGTYSAVLDWKAINDVRPIDTDAGNTRDFVLKFFDNAGNSVTKKVGIAFKCGPSQSASNGVCHDLTLDARNCGAHGNACKNTPDALAACQAGKCTTLPASRVDSADTWVSYCVPAAGVPGVSTDRTRVLFTRLAGAAGIHSFTETGCTGADRYWVRDSNVILPSNAVSLRVGFNK